MSYCPVVCQINKENGMVEASRIMNLYQFIQLYRDITSQAAEVLSAEGASLPSGTLSSGDSCQASMWMGRLGVLCVCLFHVSVGSLALPSFQVLLLNVRKSGS